MGPSRPPQDTHLLVITRGGDWVSKHGETIKKRGGWLRCAVGSVVCSSTTTLRGPGNPGKLCVFQLKDPLFVSREKCPPSPASTLSSSSSRHVALRLLYASKDTAVITYLANPPHPRCACNIIARPCSQAKVRKESNWKFWVV